VTLATDTDREIAQRLARDGDPIAFEQLYLRHTPMLYAIALRTTHNVHDSEDAVHDTWVRAVAGLQRFRGDSTLKTWLTGVLINRLRERAREHQHDSLGEVPELASGEPVTLPTNIDPIDLSRALDVMPDGYHEVLLLHDVEGFTHEEIGEVLGIEPGTSKSQLTRGRRWLRKKLEGERGPTND
jgi:RNA polymerase sigma-70 factor (ECF subfamily)